MMLAIQHSPKKRRPLTQEDSSDPVAECTQLQVLMAPMDAAVKCIESLEKTLRWPGQASAYSEIGTSFRRLFSKHYHEDQKIMTAKAAGDYKHSSCSVNAGFLQPSDQVKGVSAKYKDLATRVATHCYKVSSEQGAFHL